MPEIIYPLFPDDATPINEVLSFAKRDGQVYYFQGCLPVFSHAEDDLRSFRMFTSQLVVNGNCKQVELVKAFGVSVISVKRHVKKYRSRGPAAFYERSKQRKPRVLTPEVIIQTQGLLNEGHSTSETAKRMGIKPDTLLKAIQSGRLLETKKKLKKAAQKVTAA
jgi:hypothetical protein